MRVSRFENTYAQTFGNLQLHGARDQILVDKIVSDCSEQVQGP